MRFTVKELAIHLGKHEATIKRWLNETMEKRTGRMWFQLQKLWFSNLRKSSVRSESGY